MKQDGGVVILKHSCTMAAGRITMKKWPLLLIPLCFALMGQDRPFHYIRTEAGNTLLSITAKTLEKDSGAVVTMANAVVTTKVLTISADKMKFNRDTGEIEVNGNVQVRISK
jgi:lipopolysaccharide export system protein LptA